MALLPDLDTRSVLNIVEENFERAQLKTYAIRFIYTGEHCLPKEELIQQFEELMTDVNSVYCEVNVHGLLLVYDGYFVHIVEGSEDTVHRHLRFMLQREIDWIEYKKRQDELRRKELLEAMETEEHESGVPPTIEDVPIVDWKMFKRLKLLMTYHSISKRLFDGWRAVTARPPSLVGNFDVHGTLPEHIEQLRICLVKITRLCALAQADEELSFAGLSANDPKMEALPEVALLDFLLQSPYVLDLRHVLHLHRRVDDYAFYFERVWPLPTHFTPRFLYKLKIDDSFVEPLPVMPWELVKKEVTEEGDELKDEQSENSSSD
ncbi:uncharacterized protein LOC126970324 [Leptidea sinapis]|uniref:uncharacterized protein LOC126970324 n=1 Tax=Leptidea sinapis TaxID=189913 RepID=UPI002124B668|nr:uncharacterized protein LOC126970324 [Leptidea sinapis]